MIPKILHYCWFGGKPKPPLVRRCIASWKRHCPDWQLIEWNESNFDTNQNGYTRMCIREGRYAFLSDYVRLWAVEAYGGVYLDTDVELLGSLEDLLEEEAFFGFETRQYVATGLGFGSVAGGRAVTAMLRAYDPFLDGTRGVQPCPGLNTAALVSLGLVPDGSRQRVAGALILPPEVLNPMDSATGRVHLTANTRSIHHYAALWLSRRKRLRLFFTRPIHRIFGEDCLQWLKRKF